MNKSTCNNRNIDQGHKLLLKIGKLSIRSQTWLFSHLSLLQKNRLASIYALENFLPSSCSHLATKAPLYCAIILKLLAPSWQALFLSIYDPKQRIQEILEGRLALLKPATMQAIIDDWQEELLFLENKEGSIHG